MIINQVAAGGGEGGINTNDATAYAEHILEGYTAYARGIKLVGTYKPDHNPYGDALAIIPFDDSLENIGAGVVTPVESGDIVYAPGIRNKCLAISNASTSIHFDNVFGAKMNGNWTLSYYFKLNSSTPTNRRLFWCNYGGTYCALGEIANVSGTHRFRLGISSATTVGSVNYLDESWHFVIIRKIKNALIAIIDNYNEVIANTNARLSTDAVTDAFMLSSSSWPTQGYIDHMCFWDRALSDAECEWLWNEVHIPVRYTTIQNCTAIEIISGSITNAGNITDTNDTSYGSCQPGEYIVMGYDFSSIPANVAITKFTITSYIGVDSSINVSIPAIRKYTNGTYEEFLTGQADNGFAPAGTLAVRTFTFDNGQFGEWSAEELNAEYNPEAFSGFALVVKGTGTAGRRFHPRYFKVTVTYEV